MFQMELNFFTQDSGFPFFIQYGQHDDFMRIHNHKDFSELVCVLEGNGIHHVNQESYFIKKGDVFVINSETAHGYSQLKDFRICNIMFDYNTFFSMPLDIKKTAGFHSLFHIEPYLTKEQQFKSHLKLSLSDFEYTEKLIAHMIREYDMKPPGYMTLLRCYFLELCVFFARLYSEQQLIQKDHHIQIAEVVAFMDAHYTEPFSVSELAKKAMLSDRHFSRIFTRTYKISPIQYIHQLRLEKAALLLKNSDAPITEIAYLCGFNDSNYFTKHFKQHFGLTPSAYRKLI